MKAPGRFLLLLLLLAGVGFSLITIEAPSPANASNLTGNGPVVFNWSATTLLCTGSNLILWFNGALYSNFSFGSCAPGAQSFSPVPSGNWTWQITTDGTPTDDNTANQTFSMAPIVSLAIIYPPNNTVYGPGQCWLLTTVQLNDTAGATGSRSISCSLYKDNGTAWLLNQTLPVAVNGSVNWTGLTADSSSYAVNCTATVDGTGANSSTANFQIVGTSFCPGQPNDDSPKWNFLALIIVGCSMFLLGVGVGE